MKLDYKENIEKDILWSRGLPKSNGYYWMYDTKAAYLTYPKLVHIALFNGKHGVSSVLLDANNNQIEFKNSFIFCGDADKTPTPPDGWRQWVS